MRAREPRRSSRPRRRRSRSGGPGRHRRRAARATRWSTCWSTRPPPRRLPQGRPAAAGVPRAAPRHLAALLRLVEVCVDGDLDAALTAAQEELAEAYLAGGEAEKARVIAEDLLLRNPRSATHRDRLRRVLVTLGETDPDAIIAERLRCWTKTRRRTGPGDREARGCRASVGAAAGYQPTAASRRSRRSAHRGGHAGRPPRGGSRAKKSSNSRRATRATERRAARRSPQLPPSRNPRPTASARREGNGQLDTVPSGMRGKALQDTSCPPGTMPRGTSASARPTRRGHGEGSGRRLRAGGARPPLSLPLGAGAGPAVPQARMLTEALEWLDIAAEAPAPWSTSTAPRSTNWRMRSRPPARHARARRAAQSGRRAGRLRDARARIDRLSRVRRSGGSGRRC